MDTPPFSRVFVVCTKNHRETDIRAAFQEYGVIEDVWMVKVSTLISVTIIDANCRQLFVFYGVAVSNFNQNNIDWLLQ